MRAVANRRRGAAGLSRLALGGVTFALATAGCGRAGGVPAEWVVPIEQVASLGTDESDESTMFYRPTALGFDGNGFLHVLDAGNNRIQVFNGSGRFERTLGGPGQGPGRLSGPEDLWVAPDGEVVVADTGNRRLTRFDAQGRPLPVVSLSSVPIGVHGSADRIYVLRLPSASMLYGAESEPLITAFNRLGDEAGRYIPPVPQTVGILHFLLNTYRLTGAPEEGFVLADTHVRGRLRLFSATGTPADEIGLLYKADAWAPLGRLPNLINDASVERIARTCLDVVWDPYRNLFWALAGYTDRLDDGTWVQGVEIYRYDRHGRYRGTVVLPVAARRIAPAPDGTLWTLDTEGIARHYRFLDRDDGFSGGTAR